MKRNNVKNYNKRRRDVEREEAYNQQRNEEMQRAVNLEAVAQQREMQEAQQRGNMYSFAGNIVVANSKLVLPVPANETGLTRQALVAESLLLAQEYFKQISDLDIKLKKELEDKRSGESNGSSKIITE